MLARIMNPAASAHPIMIAVSLAGSGSLRGGHFLFPSVVTGLFSGFSDVTTIKHGSAESQAGTTFQCFKQLSIVWFPGVLLW